MPPRPSSASSAAPQSPPRRTTGFKKWSFAHLKLVIRRQSPKRWGADYQAAIEATPREAPSVSHASILRPAKLGFRDMHLLSPAERAFALLALYHPDVVDVHEQKMLSPEPRPHPLDGFPGAPRDLPPVSGLIDVADRLGYAKLLQLVKEDPPEDPAHPRRYVFPLIGDLLLYLAPPGAHPYCINWNIKKQAKAFHRPGLPNSKRHLMAQEVNELPRHEIERVYYADAGIRTEHLALEYLDSHVVANLTQLFLHHSRDLGLTPSQELELQGRFATALATDIAPLEVIRQSVAHGRCTLDQCRGFLYQAIWQRELRCNLFRPLLIDRPLHRETTDVLDTYSSWFRRA